MVKKIDNSIQDERIVPLVSVIIPTFSRPDFLPRAIESVKCQTWKRIEIIVVDDNGIGTLSQQMTASVIEKYKDDEQFYYISHKCNKNGAAARNTGIKASSGSFITFLDDDDELVNQKIELQVKKLLGKEPFYGAVYCGFRIISKNKILRERIANKEGNLQLDLFQLNWGFGTGSNPMFRREVFSEVGLFDERFVRHQDWEFMVRYFRKYEIIKIANVLINRFVDNDNNLPNIQLLIKVKSLYLNKFEPDIKKFCRADKKIIYRNQYADVGLQALLNNDFATALQYYKIANSYKILNSKIFLKAIYFTLFNRKLR